MTTYDPDEDFEVFTVTEYDTNRPPVFARYDWALDFAHSEKAFAEDRCGLLTEIGADDEATEAAELLKEGFVPAEEWVYPDSTGGKAYGGIEAAGSRGAYWSEV